MARYVKRDAEGQVVAVFAAPHPDAGEILPDDHVDVAAFLLGGKSIELARSDLEMVRVIEDVIEVLIRRNLIQITDFPEAVRDKLLQRRRARGRLSNLDNLVADDEQIL